jgi:arylsulfatase A-like enzyme
MRRDMHFPRVAAAFFLALFITGAAPAAERQRSVVLVVIDSLRPDDLQTYGSRRATSPALLEFSKTATVFTKAYSNAPWTRPSTLSLISGRYPGEISANPGGGTPLVDGHPTLATVLRSWGYRTGGFYNTAQLHPTLANIQGGFDAYVDYGGTAGHDLTKGFVARGVDQTIEFLDRSSKPTFAFLHILDPHHPYLPERNYFGKTATTKYIDSFSLVRQQEPNQRGKFVDCLLAKDPSIAGELRELYDSDIREVDAQLGRLLRFLETDKRYADALVIITSDHGEEFAEHGGWYHGRMYDESLRVPLIIRDPVRPYSRGRRVNGLVSLIDVFPTVLQSLGLAFEASSYSGKSLVEYFTRRGGIPRNTVFFDKPGCAYDQVNALRYGDWKMIIYFTPEASRFDLFNLAKDPGEQHNLSDSKDPSIQKTIRTILATYSEWHRFVTRPLATRAGGQNMPIPEDLLKRLKALGYLN